MIHNLSQMIKQEAYRLGFNACGFSKAEFLNDEKKHLINWINKGYHADMKYMENNLEKRTNPELLLPDAKSVISVLLNYFPEKVLENNKYKIAKYAYGIDYHYIIKQKLHLLADFIKTNTSENIEYFAFVDSAPVLDKVWAQKSGLGWIGKNSCLITKKYGSFTFIGGLIINIDLDYDKSHKNYCGNCDKCVKSCPTGALNEQYSIDSRKCISYLTIESKNTISYDFFNKTNGWIFGCDICQNVCPWNRFAKPTTESLFKIDNSFVDLLYNNFENFEKQNFKKIFAKSPISRIKYKKFIDNIKSYM